MCFSNQIGPSPTATLDRFRSRVSFSATSHPPRDNEGEQEARVTYVEPRGRVVTDWMPAVQVWPVKHPADDLRSGPRADRLWRTWCHA